MHDDVNTVSYVFARCRNWQQIYKMTGWISYYWATFYFEIKTKYTLFVGEIVIKYNYESVWSFTQYSVSAIYYTLYVHAHTCTGSFKKSNGNSCPASHLNHHLTPPLFVCFLLFKTKLLRVKINILALVYLKITFPVEHMLQINSPSRQNLPATSESNARPLTCISTNEEGVEDTYCT